MATDAVPYAASAQNIANDVQTIRHLNDEWIDANNCRDVPRFLSFWAEGATFAAREPAPWSATGVEEIRKLYQKLCDRFPFFFTMCHSGLITVNGDRARARWHMNEVAQGPDGKRGMINYGLYEDEWVRTEEGWKIQSRIFTYLYLDQSPLPGQWTPIPTRIKAVP